jgi:hypothetical protein
MFAPLEGASFQKSIHTILVRGSASSPALADQERDKLASLCREHFFYGREKFEWFVDLCRKFYDPIPFEIPSFDELLEAYDRCELFTEFL